MKTEYDVLVCGGGSAGYATARTSAQRGLRVGLVEMLGELGGVLTSGCTCYVMDSLPDTPVLRDIRQSSTVMNRADAEHYMVDGEKLKLFLESSLMEAGVDLMYFTKVCSAKTNGNRICSTTVADRSGLREITALAYVDATGEGDLAFFAGAGYEYGSENGEVQPMSFEVAVSGLDREAVQPFLGNPDGEYNPDGWRNLLSVLKLAGMEPTYACPLLHEAGNGLYIFNINHQYLRGCDAAELTCATTEGRRETFEAVERLRGLGGIWKNLSIVRTPSMIGIREGRRIHGKYTVTRDDLISGKRFMNAACHVRFNVDIHGKDGYHNDGVIAKPYDVPMEALMSRDFENLFMAGRDISGDYYAHASYRVTGNTFAMGESLGNYLADLLKI